MPAWIRRGHRSRWVADIDLVRVRDCSLVAALAAQYRMSFRLLRWWCIEKTESEGFVWLGSSKRKNLANGKCLQGRWSGHPTPLNNMAIIMVRGVWREKCHSRCRIFRPTLSQRWDGDDKDLPNTYWVTAIILTVICYKFCLIAENIAAR